MGICPSTGQYILHCVKRNTIKIARTIRALPDQVKWNSENIEALRVSPFYCHKSAGHGVTLQDRPVTDGDTDQLRKRPNGRKIYTKGEGPPSIWIHRQFPGVIMSADMVPGPPRVIPMRVALGL